MNTKQKEMEKKIYNTCDFWAFPIIHLKKVE